MEEEFSEVKIANKFGFSSTNGGTRTIKCVAFENLITHRHISQMGGGRSPSNGHVTGNFSRQTILYVVS